VVVRQKGEGSPTGGPVGVGFVSGVMGGDSTGA
jgi:hypothetical protein